MSDAPNPQELARAEVASRSSESLTAASMHLTPESLQAKDSLEQVVEQGKAEQRNTPNKTSTQRWNVQPEKISYTHDAQQGSHGLSGQAPK